MDDSRKSRRLRAEGYFKSPAEKVSATTSASRQITEDERHTRDAKTSRLKAQRELAEAAALTPVDESKKGKP